MDLDPVCHPPVYCPNWDKHHPSDNRTRDVMLGLVGSSTPSHHSVFDTVWQQTLTVPFFLLLVLVPIINFKSPTFFTKFNALGQLSIILPVYEIFPFFTVVHPLSD